MIPCFSFLVSQKLNSLEFYLGQIQATNVGPGWTSAGGVSWHGSPPPLLVNRRARPSPHAPTPYALVSHGLVPTAEASVEEVTAEASAERSLAAEPPKKCATGG